MKYFLLPLLLFPCLLKAQDTVYMVSGYKRTVSIYSFQKVWKNTKADSMDFGGAFLKLERRGDVYYFPKVIGDTLLRIDHKFSYYNDTFYGVCTPGSRLYDTIMIAKTEGISFMGGVTAFYSYENDICTRPLIDYLYIYYPEQHIPEKGVRREYEDYKIVSYEIRIARKQATYSN